jgi:hypothetical protein
VSLSDLKKKARKLAKETGIKHMKALEAVSIEAGYRNYREAQFFLKEPRK